MNVGEVRCGCFEAVDEVLQHRDVALDILKAAFLEGRARGVEGVRYAGVSAQRRAGVGAIHEVGANVGEAVMRRFRRVAAQADHGPVGVCEKDVNEADRGGARCARNQRGFLAHDGFLDVVSGVVPLVPDAARQF